MKRLITVVSLVLMMAGSAFAGQEYGVYVKAVDRAKGEFSAVVEQVESALTNAGWEVLASYDAGVEERCGDLRAHVVVAHNAGYAEKLMKHGPQAAFALPMRVGIYEDETGIFVDFANPSSIVRTVLGNGVEDALAAETMENIAKVLGEGVEGSAVKEQIGQLREKGHVGGMGGGKFEKKVETIHEGGEYADTVTKVQEGINAAGNGWGLVYTLDLGDVTLVGVTKSATEAKAFDIAGEKRETKTYQCPGLDHAPAFPIGVVVFEEDGKAKVTTLDEMYRMKLYFEDAGNWAFMKNMSMPGTIEDEIVEAATSKLK